MVLVCKLVVGTLGTIVSVLVTYMRQAVRAIARVNKALEDGG